MKHPDNPLLISIPFHSGTISTGLIKGEIRRAGLTVDEYLELLGKT